MPNYFEIQSAFNFVKMKIYYKYAEGVREITILLLLDSVAPLHARINIKRQPWRLNSHQLIQFPENSLGHSLGIFYQQENFEPVARAERHDVFHVLFNYKTNVFDECKLQFFLWGNGKASLFTCGACLLSILFFPNKLKHFIKHFKKGKSVQNISKLNFKELLNKNIDELRSELNFKTDIV